MDRRTFLARGAVSVCSLATLAAAGCRGRQTAQVLTDDKADMVGSHQAGAETFKPLVQESVAKLLGRQHATIQTVSATELPPPNRRICFVGVENKSAEEIGDFKDQIYEAIDTKMLECNSITAINMRFVQAALRQLRLRPDDLFLPDNMRSFAAILEKEGQPVDALLFATITSGTTKSNKDYQRDYMLTLQLVDIRSGETLKESAELRKGYNRSMWAKLKNMGS
jgi:hypothetical protein